MERANLSGRVGENVLAETTSADGQYRLQLFEADVVAIQKASPGGAWKTAYVFRDGVCPCAGHQFRGECRHKPWALSLISWGRQNLGK